MISQSLSRRIGLGRLAYLGWYAPLGAVRRSLAAGGPLEEWRDARGARAMARAATKLATLRGPADGSAPEVHFLTGRKFWYQTAFCLHSLQVQSGRVFRAVLHDDGTLDAKATARLRALFPTCEIRRRAANDERLAALLPPARFPFLHERRRSYANILKLTDVHAGATGARLVLDSDMLFFRRPDFLLAWIDAPVAPLHMVDVQDSYGYPLPLMAALAGAPIPPRINVGITGLRSETLDWDKIEFWCRTLLEAHGTSYYLEQALVAMLLAGRARSVAPAEDYRLAPDLAECQFPRAAMHHYVAGSKRGYFRHAWPAALVSLRSTHATA